MIGKKTIATGPNEETLHVDLTQDEIDAREAEALASQLAKLPDYNEKKREELIAQGTTFDGITVKNDDRTLLFFTNLNNLAQNDPNFTYEGYNAKDGNRYDLTNAQIKGIYAQGIVTIQSAFNIYNSVDEAIKAGTITTTEEIDSEYEA